MNNQKINLEEMCLKIISDISCPKELPNTSGIKEHYNELCREERKKGIEVKERKDIPRLKMICDGIREKELSLYERYDCINLLAAEFLDALFFTLDHLLPNLPKKKGVATTSSYRKLFDVLSDGIIAYPNQDFWVIDRIQSGDSLNKIKNKSAKNTILKKERDFAETLLNDFERSLQNAKSSKQNNFIKVLFLLYEFNKKSHFLDAIFLYRYDKNISFYPRFFYKLFQINKSKSFCRHTEWTDMIGELDYGEQIAMQFMREFCDNYKELCNDNTILFIIKSLLEEAGESKYFRLPERNKSVFRQIIDCANYVKKKQTMLGGRDENELYFKLISSQKERLHGFFDESHNTQYLINDFYEYLQSNRNEGKSLYSLFKNGSITDSDKFLEYLECKCELDELLPDDLREFYTNKFLEYQYLERRLDEKTIFLDFDASGRFEYNPYENIKLLEGKEINQSKVNNFGCPLHIFQKTPSEIEEILNIPIRISLIEEGLSYLEDEMEFNKNEELCSSFDQLFQEGEMLLEQSLSPIANAFRKLSILEPELMILLRVIIPMDDNFKILDFAKDGDSLHIVNHINKEAWISLHKMLCKVSYGKYPLTDKHKELECFKNQCAGNKNHYCKKRLKEKLDANKPFS